MLPQYLIGLKILYCIQNFFLEIFFILLLIFSFGKILFVIIRNRLIRNNNNSNEDINSIDKFNTTCAHFASRNGNINILEYLSKKWI
jgi:ankyrin repeat protein